MTKSSKTTGFAAMTAVVVLLLTGCFGAPTTGPDSDASEPGARLPQPADPLPLDQLAQFSGVARLEMGSNCTGTLIDTGVAAAPAYILTNGHCTGDVGRAPQQTTIAEQWFGPAEFFRAKGNLESTYSAEAKVLEYSTMRGRDLAIVRLDTTLGALKDLGVRAVPIADSEPAAGTKVVNIGVPVQDLYEKDWVLRKSECTLSAQHTLIEFNWLWFGSWANDCAGIIQGSSGSPLFSTDSSGAPNEIVAMINTTSWGVTQRDGGLCFINRPCQVSSDGVNMVEQTSYGVSVAGVNRCFNAEGVFTLGEECPLEVTDIWTLRGGGSFRGGSEPNSSGQVPEVSLVGRTAGTVRTALAPLGDGTACTNAATYSGAASLPLPQVENPWDDGLVQPVALPETEGRFVFCAVVGDDYAGAATTLFDVDRTPPIFPAGATVDQLGDGNVQVVPKLNPPEISTVRFSYGPKGSVDCTDTAGFQSFFIQPLTLFAKDLPATYCIYGLDAAGNVTPVKQIEIPKQ